MTKKITILTNIVAPYRLPLFEKLNTEYDVTVVFAAESRDHRKWSTSLERYSFDYKIFDSRTIGPFDFSYKLLRYVLNENSEAIIIGDNPSYFYLTFLKRLQTLTTEEKFIIWSEAIPEQEKEKFSEKKYRDRSIKTYRKASNYYRKYLYRLSDSVIAYSEMSHDLVSDFGVPSDKIITGQQVVPGEAISPPGELPTEIHREKLSILSLSYLERKKDVETLIKAFLDLNQENVQLLIAGDGPQKNSLVEKYGTEDDIHFLGYVSEEEKSALYTHCDIFVQVSLSEEWGLTINEAMYFGLPIIVTRSVASHEMIVKSKNGFIIPPNDISELKSKLQILFENKELRRTLSRRSKQGTSAWDPDIGVKPFKMALEDGIQ